ncbi:MAG: S-layer homology domain-containing protein [Oscillospiraceae bacterium]|nr:S-layer homology domain-containing protein [Oscillospiraceae bacterium]
MIIEAMGTPLISICVASYEPTQWFGAQDNGFTRNRRAVFSPNVGTRLYMYGGVADGVPGAEQNHEPGSAIAGTPSRFWPFPGNQFNPENRLRSVDFMGRASFVEAAFPTFDFTRAAARWDVNRAANAFGSRLPTSLAADLASVPMNLDTGLPVGAWNTRIEMIINASDPLMTDNAMNMHQDLYRMTALTPIEQMLWGFLYCDPSEVGEDLSWYYSTAHMFAPRQRYLTVSGANEAQALRNFQAMASEMMFGDGTALIIPTRELVNEMLATTNLGPDDLIGYIKMRGGAMTAETLAANAVMAGVEPEAFPVLVALAQTLTMAWEEDGHQWHAMTTASQPLSLGAVVSGPITEAIGMENEINMVGSGNSVNATLSRAFRLFYNNIAGNISGHIDTSGRTTRLNDLILVVIPENYAVTRALGWETHAEMMGFPTGSSTVSLIPWVQGTGTGGPSMETAFADPATGAWTATRTWQRNAGFVGTDIGIAFFSPAHAAEIAALDGGITKTELIQGWAVLPGTPAAPAATAYVTVNGLRAGEADRFAGMMTSGAQAGRVLARFPIVVGPPSGASFVAAGEGPFYRAGVWSTAVISGASAAPSVVQNAPTSPSAPQNVQVAVDATARTATLTWDAPAFNGNGVIEGYEVFMYHGGVMTTFDWMAVPGGAAARSFTFENLVPGEQYHFRVRAHNNVISNIYYINRQHNGHIVSGLAGVPNEFWLDLERTRGRGAWGRATCATRTAYANAADIAEGTMTAADVARGVRPIRSHVAVPGAVRPPEITAALQNLTYVLGPNAFYTVRVPQNVPFEILPPQEMTYFALPQIRYRAGGDEIPAALLAFWAERQMDPTITTTTVPSAILNANYTFTFVATGFPTPTWAVVEGAPPAGLTLGSDGVLSGIPTVTGSFTFTVQAENIIGSDTLQVTIVVAPAWSGGNFGPGPGGQQTQPPADVDLEDEDDDVPLAPGTLSFVDVPAGAWHHDAVAFVFERGIMQGTSATTFEPNTNLSRAMVATILYRLAGEPEVTYRAIFGDVASGRWYSDAVTWAFDTGVVMGFDANTFAPSANITREQFATMMFRFAQFNDEAGVVPESFTLNQIADQDSIGAWAREAMLWSVYNELITGMTPTTLVPQGTTTRAQAATILMRYIQAFVD